MQNKQPRYLRYQKDKMVFRIIRADDAEKKRPKTVLEFKGPNADADSMYWLERNDPYYEPQLISLRPSAGPMGGPMAGPVR